jgi:hypothetical protein
MELVMGLFGVLERSTLKAFGRIFGMGDDEHDQMMRASMNQRLNEYAQRVEMLH